MVLIDRTYIRELGSNSESCSTYHLVNAVASRACASLPNQAGTLGEKLCARVQAHEDEVAAAQERTRLIAELAVEDVLGSSAEFGVEMDRGMSAERCEKMFPNLYQELDRAVSYHGTRSNVSLALLGEFFVCLSSIFCLSESIW